MSNGPSMEGYRNSDESAGQYVDRLVEAIDAFDHGRTQAICHDVVAHIRLSEGVFPALEATRLLSLLRSKRHFRLMQQVADALIQVGQSTPQVRRQYAQALLDQRQLTAALAVLHELLDEPGLEATEEAEARGLIGRAFKQLYVACAGASLQRRSEIMRRAVSAYEDARRMEAMDRIWPSINVAALLARAERDGISLPGVQDRRSLAEQILQVMEAKYSERHAETWELATAMEACVALERPDDALTWAQRYVRSPFADAFEIGSSLRQLREVWQLDMDREPGILLLPLLQAELLKREGAELSAAEGDLTTDQLDRLDRAGQLEKVFGFDRFVTFTWYKLGLERCRCVARLATETAEPTGTGFLLRGADLHASFGDELLLLTNAHVLSDNLEDRAALRSDEAVITFECGGDDLAGQYRVGQILWSSPPSALDATLVRPDPPIAAADAYPVAKHLPVLDGRQRLYIIGHPRGAGLSISIHDNLLLDYDSRLIHYRAPTEPGSSGSPVFNSQWKLIGLHHAGDRQMRRLNEKPGTYEANEGIWIQAIVQAIANQYTSQSGETVR